MDAVFSAVEGYLPARADNHPLECHNPRTSDRRCFWGFYTDQGGDPADLDATMRAHAHVERHIQRLKDSGLCRFPFAGFDANTNWMMAVAMSADLVCWFQLLCFDGEWRNARSKALRWGIFHAPGRLVHRLRQRIVRIINGWPGTDVFLLGAYRRIELIA